MRRFLMVLRWYLLNAGCWVSAGFNALVLGGDWDETTSSRMGRAIRAGRCRLCYLLCRVLHWIDPKHCREAAAAYRSRRP
jgi:hypothetical protein